MAGELLARREEERGRKRDLEDTTDPHGNSPKRARSISSHSMSSVSTISTNRSYSASPRRSRNDAADNRIRDDPTSPAPPASRKRRYSHSSYDDTGSVDSGHMPSKEPAGDRNTRRRRRESSPDQRGRHRKEERHSERRYRRSRSADKDRIPRERRSPTPGAPRDRDHNRSYRDRASQPRQAQSERSRQDPQPRANQPPRERSMSPFSKRLALTQAMNMGR